MSGKRDDDDDDGGGAKGAGFASPACLMHEVDPAYMGLDMTDEAARRAENLAWRKAERERLIAARLAVPADERARLSEAIVENLRAVLSEIGGETGADGLVVSAYWPFRGEPDLRPFMTELAARGARAALPVVVERGRPLVFRAWVPGEKLVPGVWNIPVPPENAAVLTPDIVIAPLVGFDAAGYRLGYGGGFFDRTLAAFDRRPHVLGVGYSFAELPTIRPLPHDIPMDRIVTERGA